MESAMILVEQFVHNWNKDRPTMRDSNWADAMVVHLFCEEVGEFCEAFDGKTVEEMKTSIDIREELGDLGLFLISIFQMLELDFTEVCLEKGAINSLRYPARSYREGTDFTTAHTWNREFAKKTEMKKQFYAEAA